MKNGHTTILQSPMASIHASAKIADDVQIGPFSFIDEDVEIGSGTWIGPNVTIFKGARIGKDCRIFPGAVIAGIPQDLKFAGEETTVEIGDNTTIRECATVNRGTKYAWKTVVGSNCLLMAYTHVAHDCILGDNVILANSVNLAGHVQIDSFAILEGLVAVQQFVRVGAHSFIAGGSLVRKNVPPYIKAAREPLSYAGVNSIGLKRRGFDLKHINQIQDVYRHLFVSGMSTSKAIDQIESLIPDSEIKTEILEFVKNSENGILRGFNSTMSNVSTNTNSNANGNKNGNGHLNGKHSILTLENGISNGKHKIDGK